MANKKVITSAVAVVAASAMLLGGTLAWQSANQVALNEASDVVNPGGRLHDDFYIDANDDYNADIYVENFAEDEIFARVQLKEFMEIIVADGTPAENAVTVVGHKEEKATPGETDETGKNLYDYTYETHYFDAANATDEYWTWMPGAADSEEVYYMPTFNKNKDSLVADRNGMYRDRIGGISNREQDQYQEWTVYADGDTRTDTEIYDGDSNTADEVKWDFENLDLYADNSMTVDNVEHVAQPVGYTNGLISMSEWLELYSQVTGISTYNAIQPRFAENAIAILRYDKNAEDATGSIEDTEAPWGSFITLDNGSGFTREGYTLTGWNTDSNGAGESYSLGETDYLLPEGETTLYAQWVKNDELPDQPEQPEQPDQPDMSQLGNYWVYDTDGWVYWSSPIPAGETTGLLLDGIELNQVMDDTWYYAIQANAQFITADDMGSPEDGTGFYDIEHGSVPSEDALTLLGAIGVNVGGDTGSGDTGEDITYSMELPAAIPTGTAVNLGVDGYEGELTYYILNYANNKDNVENEFGLFTTPLEEKDGLKVITLDATVAGQTFTEYYYGEEFTNSTAPTLSGADLVETVTFVAMDGEDVVAEATTKVYDSSSHEYFGYGSQEEENRATGWLVFKALDGDGNEAGYCVSTVYYGVGTSCSMYPAEVDIAGGTNEYDEYQVTSVSETECDGSHGAGGGSTEEPEFITEIKGMDSGIITPELISIDNVNFWVMAKDETENKALLLAEREAVYTPYDDDSAQWEGSNAQIYLNGEWLSDKTTISQYAIETTMKVRKPPEENEVLPENEFIESTNKVFLLSEADVYGKVYTNTISASAEDYTYTGKLIAPNDDWMIYGENDKKVDWCFRTPSDYANYIAYVNPYAGGGYGYWTNADGGYYAGSFGLRPALWISLTPVN